MDGGIITLPLRVGAGGTRALLRTAASATGCAAKLGARAAVATTRAAVRVSDRVTWGRPAPSFEPPAEAATAVVSDLRPAPSVPEHSVNGDLTEPPRTQTPRVPDIAPPPEPEPEPPAEPVHVSREPELVQEVAEPGAEDGAGAAVTVGEPWPGYARMTAKQVIERLADATPAELAAVQLYESINRDRQTVRAAAERNLKSKTGRGSPN
ncbi:MAG: hypothetical protein ACXVXL_26175 [Solirubrobacteraceae bacterium]